MNIGIYAPFYHPFEGGAERVARRVAQELAAHNQVTVFTLHYDPELPAEEDDGPVHVRRLPYSITKPFGFTYVQAPELLRALQAARLDVVHIHGVIFPNLALAVTRLLRRRHVPVILAPHGLFEAFDGDPKLPLVKRSLYLAAIRPLLASLLWSVSHIALTSPEEHRLLRHFRLPARRTTLVYNGFEAPRRGTANAERFRQRHGLEHAPLLFHVASVKPNKGHDIVIRALPQILSRFPSARYVIVGKTDGLWHDYAQELMNQVAASGVGASVVFTGHVTDEELADGYAAADIALLPSFAETFPLSVLDAMAWEKPVVATNVGGIAHMLDDRQSGLIVPPGDADALAQALVQLLSDAQLRQRMGQHGATIVTRKFDWRQVIHRYEQIGERLWSAQ